MKRSIVYTMMMIAAMTASINTYAQRMGSNRGGESRGYSMEMPSMGNRNGRSSNMSGYSERSGRNNSMSGYNSRNSYNDRNSCSGRGGYSRNEGYSRRESSCGYYSETRCIGRNLVVAEAPRVACGCYVPGWEGRVRYCEDGRWGYNVNGCWNYYNCYYNPYDYYCMAAPVAPVVAAPVVAAPVAPVVVADPTAARVVAGVSAVTAVAAFISALVH